MTRVPLDEEYYKGIAEMLDVLPERVIRYRLRDRVIVYCNNAWAAAHNLTPAEVIVYEPCDPSSDNLILRLESALSLPIQIDATVAVRCPASIGHADTRTVGHDPAALLAAADAAMYEVKRAHERARHARGRRWSAAS